MGRSRVKLANVSDSALRLVVVTKEEEGAIAQGETHIEVKPAWKFLLQDLT